MAGCLCPHLLPSRRGGVGQARRAGGEAAPDGRRLLCSPCSQRAFWGGVGGNTSARVRGAPGEGRELPSLAAGAIAPLLPSKRGGEWAGSSGGSRGKKPPPAAGSLCALSRGRRSRLTEGGWNLSLCPSNASAPSSRERPTFSPCWVPGRCRGPKRDGNVGFWRGLAGSQAILSPPPPKP